MPTTVPLNPGIIPYAIRAESIGGTTELTGFGAGFGIRIVAGAQFLRRVRLTGRAEFELPTEGLHDGQVIAAPNGFNRAWLDWSGDCIPKVSRVVVEVLTQPAAVWAVTDGAGAQGARVLFESPLHVDPSGVQPTLQISGSGNNELVIADVKPGDFYQGPEGVQPGAGTLAYPTRVTGDERPRWWPSAGLYLDGFIATAGTAPATDLRLVLYAYVFTGAGTALRCFYRELSIWNTQTVLTPVTTGGTTTKCMTLADWGPTAGGPIYTLPIPIPPDGFQAVLVNSSVANTYTVYGRIGGRST